MDAGRWTLDAGPSAPYYKLTGELKIDMSQPSRCLKFKNIAWLIIMLSKSAYTYHTWEHPHSERMSHSSTNGRFVGLWKGIYGY